MVIHAWNVLQVWDKSRSGQSWFVVVGYTQLNEHPAAKSRAKQTTGDSAVIKGAEGTCRRYECKRAGSVRHVADHRSFGTPLAIKTNERQVWREAIGGRVFLDAGAVPLGIVATLA